MKTGKAGTFFGGNPPPKRNAKDCPGCQNDTLTEHGNQTRPRGINVMGREAVLLTKAPD